MQERGVVVQRCTSFLLLALFLLFATANPISAQSSANFPLPEFFGVYAVDKGNLIALVDGKSSYQHTMQGIEVASPQGGSQRRAVELSGSVRFLIFDAAPVELLRNLTLYRIPFGRNVIVRPDPLQQGPLGGLYTGGRNAPPPGIEALNEWLEVRVGTLQIRVLSKPVPGQQQMIEFVPESPLQPGIYAFNYTSGEIRGKHWWQYFAIEFTNINPIGVCVDLVLMGGFGGRMDNPSSDFPLLRNDQYRSCDAPSGDRPSGPTVETTSLSCNNYSSCLQSGMTSLKYRMLSQSLSHFQKASEFDPAKGDAWAGIGAVQFEMGQYQDAWAMFDKALQLGSTLSADVCRERGLGCDKGSFRLSIEDVAFVDVKGNRVFSASPKEVEAEGAKIYGFSKSAYIPLKVAGKKYSLFYTPDAIECRYSVDVECPEPGFTQQKVFANYVQHAISKIRAGELGKRDEPILPKSACGDATAAGYSMLLQGRIYLVKYFGRTGPDQGVFIFLDDSGQVVLEEVLVKRLAAAVWVRENILQDPGIRQGSRSVKAILQTSRSVQTYELVQDVLARALVESIRAELTGGTSLAKGAIGITLTVLRNQFTNPRVMLSRWAQEALQQTVDILEEMERNLPPDDAKVFEVERLELIKSLHTQAQFLQLPFGALAAALMPKAVNDLTSEALKSLGSQFLGALPASDEVITLGNLLDATNAMVNASTAVPALREFQQKWNLATQLAKANEGKMSAFIGASLAACRK